MSETTKAVFLSYASQDSEAAKRVCESLRQAGVEVWFDQSELRGGDAWDAKIRKQIKECALFVPVISANTQARLEGYFRLEWKLAEDRSHLMAKGKPFIVPVCVDGTKDWDAHVPDAFTTVQWVRLPGGETPAAFCARVSALLAGGETGVRTSSSARTSRPGENALPGKARPGGWKLGVALAVAIVAGLIWREWRKPTDTANAPAVASAPAATNVSEARQLLAKARELFYRLDETREDYRMAEEFLKQAVAKDAADAEVWAAYSQLHQRHAARGWDVTDQRRDEARAAAQRALRLDPKSFEARFAEIGLTIYAAGDTKGGEAALRALLSERPDDQRVLRALGSLVRNSPGRRDEALRFYDQSAALPGGDPLALYNKALTLWFAGRATAAEQALHASLAQKPFSSSRLLDAYFALSLRGDVERAVAKLNELPAAVLLDDRGCFFAYLTHRYGGKPDAALAAVRQFSRDWMDDGWYRGPRALLTGEALLQAGRPDAAAIEWRTALKVADARLAAKPNEQSTLVIRLFLLGRLGEMDTARKLYPSVRQLVGADTPGALVSTRFTAACVVLGEHAEALRQIAVALGKEVHAVYFTAADLRLEPTWGPLRENPEFARLIAEAERLEKAGEVAPVAPPASTPATK